MGDYKRRHFFPYYYVTRYTSQKQEGYSKKVFSSIGNGGGDLFNCYSWDNNLPSCDYLTFIWALFSPRFLHNGTSWRLFNFHALLNCKFLMLDGVTYYFAKLSTFSWDRKCHLKHFWSKYRGRSSLQNSLVFPMNFWLLKFCKNPLNPQIAQIVSLCYFSQLCG